MRRTADQVLKDINYYLKVRDYLVSTPMFNTTMHQAAVGLAIEKLNELEREYRSSSRDKHFSWHRYQFAN